MDSFWDNWFIVLLPTILVGLLFWFIMRAVMHADRTERKVYAEIEAQERERLGQPAPQEDAPHSRAPHSPASQSRQ